jgi:hypothetical protein
MTDQDALKRWPLKRVLVIGYFALLGACLLIFALSAAQTWNLSTELVGFLSVIATGCLASLKDAISYEFGSTRGSQAKDAVIANLTNGKEKPHGS